jgi:heme-degrading monooxygenase HmoA
MAFVEIARYRLREGADEAALTEAEEEIQRTIGPSHPGYVGRHLLKGADGTYVLIMHWENQQAADTWNATLFGSKAGQKLGPLVDGSSMSMERLTPLKP